MAEMSGDSHPLAIDPVELAHLVDIRGWRATVETQLEQYRERVRTFEAELHDSAVMERGHLAFLHRKYGAESVNPDGTLNGVPPLAPAAEPAASVDVDSQSGTTRSDPPVEAMPTEDLAPNETGAPPDEPIVASGAAIAAPGETIAESAELVVEPRQLG